MRLANISCSDEHVVCDFTRSLIKDSLIYTNTSNCSTCDPHPTIEETVERNLLYVIITGWFGSATHKKESGGSSTKLAENFMETGVPLNRLCVYLSVCTQV